MRAGSTATSKLTLRIATLVGTGIEILTLAPFLMVLYTTFYRSSYTRVFGVAVLEWGTMVILYVVLPVVYSVIVSPRLQPKRIVSPLLIQIFSVAIVGIIAFVILLSRSIGLAITNMSDYMAFLGLSGMVWLISFALFGLLGFWQTLVVRWIVGLNDGKPDDVTYSVDIPFETVRLHAVKEEFCDFWGLKLQDNSPEIVLRSRFSVGNTLKSDVILVIAPSGQNKTLIHGSAFAEALYDVAQADDVTSRRDHIINDLVGILPGDLHRQLIKDDANLTRISHRFVESCTRSKITRAGIRSKASGWLRMIAQMPRVFRFAIGVTVFAWVLVDVLFWFLSKTEIEVGPIPVIEVNVILLTVTVGELLIPAWEQIRQREPRLRKRSRVS